MTVASSIPDALLDAEVINLHIGRRLRRRRRVMGLTQEGLGTEIGVTFQQVQKYECAANRISAARLFMLATALRVPMQYFFDGVLAQPTNDHRRSDDDMPESNEARDVLEAYFRLPATARKRLIAFLRSLSEPASA